MSSFLVELLLADDMIMYKADHLPISSENPPTGKRHVPVTNCNSRVLLSLSSSFTNCNTHTHDTIHCHNQTRSASIRVCGLNGQRPVIENMARGGTYTAYSFIGQYSNQLCRTWLGVVHTQHTVSMDSTVIRDAENVTLK